jgi:hypothetical protein
MDFIFNIEATKKPGAGSDAYVHRSSVVGIKKGGEQEVASLQLPPGDWVVTAKAVVEARHVEERFQKVKCRLVVTSMDRRFFPGSSEDTAQASLTPVFMRESGGNEVLHCATVTLILGVELTSVGFVTLSGQNTNGSTLFTDIVISAIRVNSLTVDSISPPVEEPQHPVDQ